MSTKIVFYIKTFNNYIKAMNNRKVLIRLICTFIVHMHSKQNLKATLSDKYSDMVFPILKTQHISYSNWKTKHIIIMIIKTYMALAARKYVQKTKLLVSCVPM